MSKKRQFVVGLELIGMLGDDDWFTILAALTRDPGADSRRLLALLLRKTRCGRHVRLIRLMVSAPQRFEDLARKMGVSRRTIFRDLNDLESYGVVISVTDNSRYQIDEYPARFEPLVRG